MNQLSSVEIKEVIKTLTDLRQRMIKYEVEMEKDDNKESNILLEFSKYIENKIRQTKTSSQVKIKMSNLIDSILTNKK